MEIAELGCGQAAFSTTKTEPDRGKNMKSLELKDLKVAKDIFSRAEQQPPADARAVLKELFELLEEYAPAWYTQAHHDRAIAALHEG